MIEFVFDFLRLLFCKLIYKEHNYVCISYGNMINEYECKICKKKILVVRED